MSLEDYMEEPTAKDDKTKKSWRKGWKWLNIIGISNDDLKNGSNYIEKLKYPPWDKRNNENYKADPEEKINYGKHSGKSYSWIKENDSNYYNWMMENNAKFRQKIKELNLED